MPAPNRTPSPMLGFLIGLLVIALPLAFWLSRRPTAEGPSGTVRAPEGAVGAQPGQSNVQPGQAKPGQPGPPAGQPSSPTSRTSSPTPGGGEPSGWAIDYANLRPAGAAMPSTVPLPPRAALLAALRKTESWLAARAVDPFAGSGLDSLRVFALEVECWHRLALAQTDPARRRSLQEEVRKRLALFAGGPLRERLAATRPGEGFLEVLMLLSRAREYGVDAPEAREAVAASSAALTGLLERAPATLAAIYAAQMTELPLPGPPPGSEILSSPTLTRQPRETSWSFADVAALTQEIFARTGMAQRPLEGIDAASRAYLARALPHFCLSTEVLLNVELCADLASSLAVAGLTDTYGYREAIRFLLAQQNADGGFGSSDPSMRARRWAITSGCVTALSLVPSGGGAG